MPEATSGEIERGVFVECDEMRFEVDQAGDPAGDHLALFLHGFPELNFAWRYQLPVFAERGYKAWAPNQRGYGRSSRPLGIRNYAMNHLMDDVTRLIDASGCSKVTLIAHDWGGVVAWSYAMLGERPIERLIAMNIPHPVRMQAGQRSLRQLRKSWYAYFFQLPKLPERILGARHAEAIGRMFRETSGDPSRFPDDVVQVFRDNAAQPGALTAMINWYRAMRYQPREFRDAMASPPIIRVPTLMLWGENDVALGKELTFGTDELVEDLTLRYFPGVSHWIQQEEPEAVNAAVEAWLDGQEVPEFTRRDL